MDKRTEAIASVFCLLITIIIPINYSYLTDIAGLALAILYKRTITVNTTTTIANTNEITKNHPLIVIL